MGDVLGEKATADRYRAAAKGLKSAFNTVFLDPAAGHYRTSKDPGYRQPSNAVPLVFGLVPTSARASVANSLVDDIAARGNHLNTGALGTSVLLRALTAEGHPEVAHAIATQRHLHRAPRRPYGSGLGTYVDPDSAGQGFGRLGALRGRSAPCGRGTGGRGGRARLTGCGGTQTGNRWKWSGPLETDRCSPSMRSAHARREYAVSHGADWMSPRVEDAMYSTG
ncbi:hypothetical protein SM007_32605 [Streptomyces avermitilis]|uniref:alpha-L-rhamnosidase n=1 Tax=Streptomyces avermitilis TaxID=33903 RepID=A0A4D4M9C9_STRAX|nr:hypothetical protein SM007_32605 [Streptomyces avermitilis]GDY68448.1 hypothetical protein SAV14893_078410 [Streptomyces avermitilis]GDY71179.1 hypothetical protein SAV31267_006640 [Streptomyces avermitilis]